jgi:hypothetical protein
MAALSVPAIVHCALLLLIPSAQNPVESSTAETAAIRRYPWETIRDFEVRKTLETPIEGVNLNAETFDKALKGIADVTGLSIHPRWMALESAGIERDSEVNLKLKHVSGAAALRQVLNDVGAGETELQYEVCDGIVEVSTREDLSRDTITVVYDCGDLLNVEEKHLAMYIDRVFQAVLKYTARDISHDAVQAEHLVRQVIKESRKELRDELIEIIQTTIDPESWRESGGNVGAISVTNDRLVIVQVRDAHMKISNFLDKLRQPRSKRDATGRWP